MPLPLRLDEWSKVDDAESWRDPILIPLRRAASNGEKEIANSSAQGVRGAKGGRGAALGPPLWLAEFTLLARSCCFGSLAQIIGGGRRAPENPRC